jgi:hypothetical protein
MNNETVKVIFRHFQDDIIALFPEEVGTLDPDTCMSYMHIGQHSSAHLNFVMFNSKNPYKVKKAKQVKELKDELKDMGYELKEIRNVCQYQHYKEVRKAKLVEMEK